MNVWRIHIKNDVTTGYTREDLLAFCQKEALIGVGWNAITTKADDETEIRKQAQCYPNATAGIKAVNAMRKMQLDDLIWTRLNGIYYLCRVTGLWKDRQPTKLHFDLDISNYVQAEWLVIGTEDCVPGKVISSFRPAASAQSIRGVEEISAYLWNTHSQTSHYAAPCPQADIWSILSAESIEEVALLYLQVKKGYYIYTETVKHATREYECVMVHRDGHRAYPQVKSGAVALHAADYMDAVVLDSTAHIYLFAVSENYFPNGSAQVHFLTKKELEGFLTEYRRLLPVLTSARLETYGFFEAKQS